MILSCCSPENCSGTIPSRGSPKASTPGSVTFLKRNLRQLPSPAPFACPTRYRDPWGTDANEPNEPNEPNLVWCDVRCKNVFSGGAAASLRRNCLTCCALNGHLTREDPRESNRIGLLCAGLGKLAPVTVKPKWWEKILGKIGGWFGFD